ncbi:MAG: LysR substrate-binding domain-containing protein [Polyangiaceae bacterium]
MIPSAVFSISAVQAFVQVSELRSFRRAAVALGVTPAAVSKAIAALEEQAGVSLLDRTSRGVALTDPGARLLPYCKQALEALTSGEAALHEATTRVRGALRVSLPFVLGPLLVQALPRFLDRFPEVTFDLRFTDRFVWLLEEDVDLALRIGELPDSSLRAKRLGRLDWVTIASADYLRRHGTPERPRALLEHRCLKFRAPSGLAVEWVFATTASAGRTGRVISLPDSHVFDQGERLVDAAAAGLGVAQVFGFLGREAVASGRVQAILADYSALGPPIHALTKPGQAQVPRVRALLAALPDLLGFPHPQRSVQQRGRARVRRDG